MAGCAMKYLMLPVFFLCGCVLRQDPLQSDAMLGKALEELPYVPPAVCPEPDWAALSLTQSIATGLCKHPETRAAFAEMENRSAAWGQAQAAYLPTLSASYRREHTQSRASFAGVSDKQNPGRLLAEMQWVLFDFGERAANREQGAHLLRLAAAGYDRQLQNRWATIAGNYINADTAARKAAVGEDYVAVAAHILDSVQNLHDAGVAIAADVREAQVEYRRAELQSLQSGQEQRNAQAALAESMGYAVDTAMRLEALDDDHFSRKHGDDVKELLTQMLDAHPAIVEAQAQADATLAGIAANRHAGSPQLFLYATATLNHHLQSRGMRYRENDHVVGVGIRWPVFEGYRRHYREKALKAQYEKELAALDALQSRLSLEVWQAYHQWQSAQAQREVARLGVESAEKNAHTRLGRYHAGVGELRDVLQAQRTLQEMRLAEADARQAQHEAGIQLIFSLSRAFSQQ